MAQLFQFQMAKKINFKWQNIFFHFQMSFCIAHKKSSFSWVRGNCYPRSRCQTRHFQTRHFEKPLFPCFESQKLVKLICDTVTVCNFVTNQFNPTF